MPGGSLIPAAARACRDDRVTQPDRLAPRRRMGTVTPRVGRRCSLPRGSSQTAGEKRYWIGLHPATSWRDARLADPPSNSKAGAIQERDLVGPAFGQGAAPLLQAAVVLEAATSAKQQSALETRRRLQRV